MKKILLSVLIANLSSSALAGGIPVIDGAALGQWGTNLVEAGKRLEQLKQTHSAIVGSEKFDWKSFAKLNLASLGDIEQAYQSLAKGEIPQLLIQSGNLMQQVSEYCKNSANENLCKNASLSSLLTIKYSEKMQETIKKELKQIDKLANQLSSANSVQEIQHLQAAISIQTNKIALIEKQEQNFYKMLEAQKEEFIRQKKEARTAYLDNLSERLRSYSSKGEDFNSALILK